MAEYKLEPDSELRFEVEEETVQLEVRQPSDTFINNSTIV